MKRNRNRAIGFMLCACLIALVGMRSVMALETIDRTRAVSLTIRYQHEEKTIAGAQFDLYLVAETDELGKMNAVAPFDRYPVKIVGEEEAEWKTLASTLEGYVLKDQIPATASGRTDEHGVLIFGELRHGLYLVIGHEYEQNDLIYRTDSFVVRAPGMNETQSEWLYDMTVHPKCEAKRGTEEQKVDRKVLKIWNDEGSEAMRPAEIVVHLLENGTVYETVALKADNNWRYEWKELNGLSSWTVVEDEPEGYTVQVSQEGITFVVTNTREEPEQTPEPSITPTVNPGEPTPTVDPGEPTPTVDPGEPTPTVDPGEPTPTVKPSEPTPKPTEEPDDPKLPQTGQVWWPVPLLVTLGLLLIILGLIRRRGEA